MKIYLGQTRADGSRGGHDLIGELSSLGIGEMVQPGEFPPRRFPYACDNGAYADFLNDRPFNSWRFCEMVGAITRADVTPDFVVVPDIVAGGKESLAFSIEWGRTLRGVAPLYVAIQDGMNYSDLQTLAGIAWVDGYFVGGSTEWKERNALRICDFAHSVGRPCHVGRIGTGRKARWARRIGADSSDSALPLRSRGNLNNYLYGVNDPMLPIFCQLKEGKP